MPLRHLLAWFGHHVVPMAGFHGPGPTAQNDLADHLVAAHLVKVHHRNVQRGFADLLPGDLKDERLVVDGVERAHLDVGLLLLHPRGAEVQPDLHVGIWRREERITCLIEIRFLLHAIS